MCAKVFHMINNDHEDRTNIHSTNSYSKEIFFQFFFHQSKLFIETSKLNDKMIKLERDELQYASIKRDEVNVGWKQMDKSHLQTKNMLCTTKTSSMKRTHNYKEKIYTKCEKNFLNYFRAPFSRY